MKEEKITKHTPGPWVFRRFEGERRFWIASENVKAFRFNGPEVVGVLSSAHGDETDYANARLIAVAPELLEASRGARDILSLLLPIFASVDTLYSIDKLTAGHTIAEATNYADGVKGIIQTIDALIAKAEGK